MSIEEAGGIVKSGIDALKSTPGLLAVVLLQTATIVVIYFSIQDTQARAHEREMKIIDRCFPLNRTKE